MTDQLQPESEGPKPGVLHPVDEAFYNPRRTPMSGSETDRCQLAGCPVCEARVLWAWTTKGTPMPLERDDENGWIYAETLAEDRPPWVHEWNDHEAAMERISAATTEYFAPEPVPLHRPHVCNLRSEPTPPSEKRCPTCKGKRDEPGRDRGVLCPDPFHSPDAPLIETKAHASPEVDEQGGACSGPSSARSTFALNVVAASCDCPDGLDDYPAINKPLEVVPASSSIPTEKVREIRDWMLARDFIHAACADRLSALLEGTDDE